MILAGRTLDRQSGHDAAWELLAALYLEETGEKMPKVLKTERGKPYFSDGKWHFSLTHTRRHAFCALSDRPIGIDAEELDRDIDLRLAEKILSPGERAQFERAPDKRLALLTFWVLKEAAAKQTGEGVTSRLWETEFSLHDPAVRLLDGCLVAVIDGAADR